MKTMTMMRPVILSAGVAMLGACGMPVADTPLTIASESGDAVTIRTLLARGADANGKDSSGLTPLVRAARRGHYDAAKALLDSIWSRPGWSPLMNAVHKSQPRIVKLLIDAGADVNARASDGTTPLALAEDKDITAILVAAGASPHRS